MEDSWDSCIRSLKLQYLVKLKGFSDDENTWELVAHIGENSMKLVEEFY